MARIRTVKPEFFRHEKLFDAEQATGLPLRLAFAGLWTVADREGRFRWRPRTMKPDILPYDEVDFSAVMDALHEHGLVRRYEHDGEHYGYIPSFARHQHLNPREAKSVLPSPDDSTLITWGELTRQPRVNGASARVDDLDNLASGEGKGREGEREQEMEGEGGSGRKGKIAAQPPRRSRLQTDRLNGHKRDFEIFYQAFNHKKSRGAAEKAYEAALKIAQPADILVGAISYARSRQGQDPNFTKHPATWLNQKCWLDEPAKATAARDDPAPDLPYVYSDWEKER